MVKISTPGERLQYAREEVLGITRQEASSRIGRDYSEFRIAFIESGRTKMTEKIAVEVGAPLGLSTRWLLEGEGEILIDAQYLKNLRHQMYERGIITPEEWKMLEHLRSVGIKTDMELEAIIRGWTETRRLVAETEVKYKPRRQK